MTHDHLIFGRRQWIWCLDPLILCKISWNLSFHFALSVYSLFNIMYFTICRVIRKDVCYVFVCFYNYFDLPSSKVDERISLISYKTLEHWRFSAIIWNQTFTFPSSKLKLNKVGFWSKSCFFKNHDAIPSVKNQTSSYPRPGRAILL